MSVCILVSTMHQENDDILSNMNIRSQAVIVNQNNINLNDAYEIEKNDKKIKWINVHDKGLSKSRNIAITNSIGDISVLADDDLIYLDDYEERIESAFEKYPNADIICFKIEGIEREFKSYKTEPERLNFISAMKRSSVEIAFRTEAIKAHNLKFKEEFGAGATYYMGEENIFLSEALRKGLMIQYVPITIAKLHLGNSTWFKGYTEDFFVSRGASFYAMDPSYSMLLILQWAIRKRKEYGEEISFSKALRYMLNGRKKAKKL